MTRPPRCILLAEDDGDIALIVRRTLETQGHRVIHVANADQVLPKVILETPDLVILDVMMPSDEGLDGFALCQRLKESPHHRHIPVIMTSAIAEGTGKSEEEMRRSVGAEVYLHKPFDMDRLAALVSELTA